MRVPGQMRDHYAPTTPLWCAGPAGLPAQAAGLPATPRLGWLQLAGAVPSDAALAARRPGARWTALSLSPDGQAASAAQALYAQLRRLDAAGLDAILVPWPPPDAGLWAAVGDRLLRAMARHLQTVPDPSLTPGDKAQP